jgi:glycosyltransferase involved in cell wall biosynthesis
MGAPVDLKDVHEAPAVGPAVKVLFVTTDASFLGLDQENSHFMNTVLASFAEVHVLVVRQGIAPKRPVLRVAPQAWLYTVAAKYSWQLPFVAWRAMHEELAFAGGFRPDIVIARDPDVSGIIALGLSRRYHCPVQLHLPIELPTLPSTTARMLRRFVINSIPSIRVETEEALAALSEQVDTNDVAVLPKFRDYNRIVDGTEGSYLKTRYPQFNFIVMYYGRLTSTKAPFLAIDALRPLLRNPRVGFVMVGSGVAVGDCERRVELLGMKEQVIFERNPHDIFAYVRSADALIVTDESATADEVVMMGAAAGAPMVMIENAVRKDFFSRSDSAVLLSSALPDRYSESLTRLLNDNALRVRMRQITRAVAEAQLIEDPAAYQTALEDSIGAAIINQAETV